MSTHKDSPDLVASLSLPVGAEHGMTEEGFVSCAFQQETAVEWVDGELILMSPITVQHDELCNWLSRLLAIYAEDHDLGTVHGPEVQVRFATIPSRRQPDVVFLSKTNRHRLCEKYIEGPPDLIVEIVSPDSIDRDWHDKFKEYELAGVGEYCSIR